MQDHDLMWWVWGYGVQCLGAWGYGVQYLGAWGYGVQNLGASGYGVQYLGEVHRVPDVSMLCGCMGVPGCIGCST